MPPLNDVEIFHNDVEIFRSALVREIEELGVDVDPNNVDMLKASAGKIVKGGHSYAHTRKYLRHFNILTEELDRGRPATGTSTPKLWMS